MLKKIADAAPATFIALGSGSILLGFFRKTQTLERLNAVLPYPWSIFWLIMLCLGSAAVVVGVCLRSRNPLINGRAQDWGLGLEMSGNFAVGSGFLVYSLIIAVQFPFWNIFPSLCWFWALMSAFYGPVWIIVRDLVRAHQREQES